MNEEKVYIAVSQGEIEYPEARDSIQLIITKTTDSLISFARATKGYESRQQHIENFLETDYDYILFLDGDQIFPRNTLERLRSHGLPFVSGFYTRRRFDLIAPVWYDNGDELPLRPWTSPLEPDSLYKIGASGWGCLLVHRKVIEKMAPLLKGEWFVLEDDLDIMPYNLPKILRAVKGLRYLVSEWKKDIDPKEAEVYVQALEEEIKPVTYIKEPTGSDVRFCYLAKLAGFQLYGDTGVNARHIVNYPLGLTDYQRFLVGQQERLSEYIDQQTATFRGKVDGAKWEAENE